MNRHAILIANGSFPQYKNLPPLETPAKDIERLSAVLKDNTRGFAVETLKDCLSHEVNERLEDILNNDVAPEDLVLIYYSGHGLLDERLHLSLATFNTKPKCPTSSVAFSNVMAILETARIRRVIVLLDCCYSGAAGKDFESKSPPASEIVANEILSERGFEERTRKALELTAAAERMESKAEEQGIYLMTASSASQPALAQKEGLGLFTQHLVSGFEGKALSNNKSASTEGPVATVTVNSLFRHIHKGLQDMAVTQTPRLFVSRATTEDMVIAEISALVGEHSAAGFRLWDEVSLLENTMPTYILDEEFRFLHWNAAFQGIVAEPLKLTRGSHVQTFLERLENWKSEVSPRSVKDFPPKVPEVTYPRVHTESLKLRTEKFGYIDFTKIASHVRDDKGNWCVILNISYAERQDTIWKQLREAMTREESWSRYAECYDPIIADFSQNKELVERVVRQVGNARNCLDVGAGTGSTTLRLLETVPTRRVHAVDINYQMLRRLYEKLGQNADFKERTKISHGDCLTALNTVKESIYDACVMMNVLFALDEPIPCLKEIHRVLKSDGIIVLSTSDEATDIEALFRQIQSELETEQKWDTKMQTLHANALARNREILTIIRRYSESDVIGFLKEAGFEKIRVIARRQYVGCVFIVSAHKRLETSEPPGIPAVMGREVTHDAVVRL